MQNNFSIFSFLNENRSKLEENLIRVWKKFDKLFVRIEFFQGKINKGKTCNSIGIKMVKREVGKRC